MKWRDLADWRSHPRDTLIRGAIWFLMTIATIIVVTLMFTRWNPFVHAAVSAAVIITAVTMLTRWRHRYNLAERLGLALAGGAGLLRINVIYEMDKSPFFDWAPTLLMVGVWLFMKGRSMRDAKHEAANREQIRRARTHLEARGLM